MTYPGPITSCSFGGKEFRAWFRLAGAVHLSQTECTLEIHPSYKEGELECEFVSCDECGTSSSDIANRSTAAGDIAALQEARERMMRALEDSSEHYVDLL